MWILQVAIAVQLKQFRFLRKVKAANGVHKGTSSKAVTSWNVKRENQKNKSFMQGFNNKEQGIKYWEDQYYPLH